MVQLKSVLISLALIALGGCASGNTASFTQAPLFFSDEVAEDGVASPFLRAPDARCIA